MKAPDHSAFAFATKRSCEWSPPTPGSIIGGYVPERIDFIWTNAHVLSCEAVLRRMPGTELNYSGECRSRAGGQMTSSRKHHASMQGESGAHTPLGTLEGGLRPCEVGGWTWVLGALRAVREIGSTPPASRALFPATATADHHAVQVTAACQVAAQAAAAAPSAPQAKGDRCVA